MAGRNVINVAAVDEFLDTVAMDCRFEATEAWLKRSVRRWVLSAYDQFWLVAREPMTDRLVLVDPIEEDKIVGAYEDEVPNWAISAIARGDPLINLRLNQTLARRLHRIITWIDETADPDAGPKLDRLSFVDADAQAGRWWRSQERPRRWASGVVPVFHRQGNTVVKLTNGRALRQEGNAMNHCVGDYEWEVREGISEIYSVRAPNGAPQATIEVDPGKNWVLQVKGPSNGEVPAPYRSTVMSFLSRHGLRLMYDQENVQLDPTELDWTPEQFHQYIRGNAGADALRLRSHAMPEDVFGDRQDMMYLYLRHCMAGQRPGHRRRVYNLLSPEGPPIAFRPYRQIWAYGELWPVWHVCTPVILLVLAAEGTFHGLNIEEQILDLRSRLMGMVPMLLYREPDRLFDLGPLDIPEWVPNDIAFGPVAWIRKGELDLDGLREARHTRIRQRLNAAKRREIGKWARRSEEHEEIRWILDGETGRYII